MHMQRAQRHRPKDSNQQDKGPDRGSEPSCTLYRAENHGTLYTLPKRSLTGSAASTAAFWAIAVNSFDWAVIASYCLRVCAVETSTASDRDLIVMSWVAKSKAEFVFSRAASISFSPKSETPFVAVA